MPDRLAEEIETVFPFAASAVANTTTTEVRLTSSEPILVTSVSELTLIDAAVVAL